MRKTIDHQKTKFYQAEFSARRELFNEHIDEEDWYFGSFQEAYDLLGRIKKSDYYLEHNGSSKLEMIEIDGIGRDCGYYLHQPNPLIMVSHDCLRHDLICHEVAHHLTYQISPEIPDHGPTFVMHYLNLLIRQDYTNFAACLIRALHYYNVDFHPHTMPESWS